MSFWRGKPGQVAPVALLLLIAFAALPFILYFISRPSEAPPAEPISVGARDHDRGPGQASPTIDMTVGESGFGTVTEAPLKLVEMDQNTATPPPGLPVIEPSIARFLRPMPEIETGGPKPGPDGTIMCTLEGPAVWRGHLELRDGCLILVEEGGGESLLMLPNYSVARDAEGYLSIASPPFTPENTLRVGEREGRFTGKGCSQPSYLPAPPALAKTCGVDRVVNMARLGRKPICSDAELQRIARARREYRETSARIRAEHDRCVAGGKRADRCPPPMIPYPVELDAPACRDPEGKRISPPTR